MTAREPKDLRELLILTSQTPESSNIIPPDNKRKTHAKLGRSNRSDERKRGYWQKVSRLPMGRRGVGPRDLDP